MHPRGSPMSPDLFSLYTDFIARVLRRIRLDLGIGGISISYNAQAEPTLDERIKKIDRARENLLDGLAAIDELRKSAEENKKEVQQAMQSLARLESDKQKLEATLKSIREVARSDVQAFREMAGIPSLATIRRERVIGFFSGAAASIVASGVVYAIAHLVHRHWP